MKVHEKIRFLRKEKNWTQEQMAEKLGMSSVSYGKVERGETDYTAKLEKIADALDMDLMELLALHEKNVFFLLSEVTNVSNSLNPISHIVGSPKELTFEIQKLQLIIEHEKEIIEQKDVLLAQKDKDIARLESMIELLKKRLPT